MLDDELQLVRQGWLWKGGKTFGQYTQKRRHFLLVRAYGKAMLLHSADGVDVDAAALAGELHRRKRIDLMDDCDVHPWDPRPAAKSPGMRPSRALSNTARLPKEGGLLTYSLRFRGVVGGMRTCGLGPQHQQRRRCAHLHRLCQRSAGVVHLICSMHTAAATAPLPRAGGGVYFSTAGKWEGCLHLQPYSLRSSSHQREVELPLGFLLTTRRRSYELDAPDRKKRDAWVADVLSVLASAMSQSSRPETMLRRHKDRSDGFAPPSPGRSGVDWRTAAPPPQ